MLDIIMDIKPQVISRSIFLEDYFNLLKEAEEYFKEAQEARALGQTTKHRALMRKYDTYVLAAESVLNAAIKRPIAEA